MGEAMTDKHTSGPWTAHRAKTPSDTGWDYGITATINGSIRCIGEAYDVVGHDVKAPAEANARLISAAPDMLEALENAVLQIEYLHDKYKETGTGNHALNLARAAISKAKGETT